ncbi:hypothetical protein DPMN_021648 [Dreissena polymorpha]|uniref:C2H2-type domain-containing protein n=1 Tax=Dreissena polymorpha TaxID=45954 RepID=A0A9D4NN32_DREPO|nr:hypothetical protein DPMN_021648 [Dreissena polymorpha]
MKAFADSLDPDETPQNVASHQDPNYCADILRSESESASASGRQTKLEFYASGRQTVPEFYCSVCSFKGHSPYALRNHVKSHTSDFPFQCKYCDMPFRKVLELTKHVQYPTDRYISSHTNVSGGKTFKCLVCSQTMPRKNSMSRHILTHLQTKPYQCNICDHRCNRRDALRKHYKRIHAVTWA